MLFRLTARRSLPRMTDEIIEIVGFVLILAVIIRVVLDMDNRR